MKNQVKFVPTMPLKTTEDWWKAVDAHFNNIKEIMSNCGIPYHKPMDIRVIETHDDFVASECGLNHQLPKPLDIYMDELRQQRDPALADFFQKIWVAAPDKPWIHEWPSWGMLCDLCSECYLVQEEEWIAQEAKTV